MIAASVWIAPSIGALSGEVISRLIALTMPLVTVSSSPNGLPIATTPSPTATLLESPSVSGTSFDAGASTWMTARSVSGSVPTTVALVVDPSENFTVTELAPSTTWSFVTMSPLVS